MLKASGRDSITVMSRIEVLPRTGTDWEWTLGSGIHYSQGGLSTEPSDWNETTRARHPLEGCSPLGQAALLRWARAERGPPMYPNLPERLGLDAYFIEGIRNADAFREALESDPTQVRNPRVRCWVEHGRIPQEIPGQPRICPE